MTRAEEPSRTAQPVERPDDVLNDTRDTDADEPTALPRPLAEWAHRPGSQALLAEARRRAERRTLGDHGPLRVSLTASERRDVGILLGITWEAGAASPSIDVLRKRLGDYGLTLEKLLAATGGPLVDRVAHRERLRAARAAEEERAARVLTAALGPAVAAAVATRCLPAAGAGARLHRAEQLAAVARDLSGDAEGVSLAVLAARSLGDAHALDRTTALGRAAARMAAVIGAHQTRSGRTGSDTSGGASVADGTGGPKTPGRAGTPKQSGIPAAEVGDEALTAEAWRAAWAAVGIACDRVSSTVLVLNLPLTGSEALRTLTSVPGEPVWVTTRALDAATHLRPTASPPVVFVCENPSVVESAADRLGARSAPLVCTYGKPSQAALTLLRALDRCGVPVRVRADNDPAGRSIVAAVLALCPRAAPWRFEASSPTFEEQLVDNLLADLDH